MSHFTYTLAVASILVMLALLGLGLGFLIGKKKLRNQCGYNPDHDKDSACGGKKSCGLCDPSSKEDSQ